MVAEMKIESGPQGDTREAFLAARLPVILENEIKKKHAEFYKAAEKLTADDLFDTLPISCPMTHVVEGNIFSGAARYPILKGELRDIRASPKWAGSSCARRMPRETWKTLH